MDFYTEIINSSLHEALEQLNEQMLTTGKPIIIKETEVMRPEEPQKALELENELNRLEKLKGEGSLTENEYLKLKDKAINGF